MTEEAGTHVTEEAATTAAGAGAGALAGAEAGATIGQGGCGEGDLPFTCHTDLVHTLLHAHQLPPLARGPAGIVMDAFVCGLPARPLLTPVLQALAAWAITGSFPFPLVGEKGGGMWILSALPVINTSSAE